MCKGKKTMASVAAGLALFSGAALAGTLTGGLAFPGDEIPALTVVAVDQGSGKQFTMQTRVGQRSYRLAVPEGRYIVFAVPHGAGVADEPGQTPMRGAYSKFSACVMSAPDKAAKGGCNEHELLVVEVGAKATLRRIDLYDWYLPETEKGRLLAIKLEGKAAKQ